ncbi:AraC family ligand binding domain-containing protein [Akkermansiaceae bacterium]|nr:AraC family ligand binding domain-containing protein [Akkermansiaceae bacterium]MDA8976410.1 AraC family ligand binding domain-containing protein [bacterium]MDB4510119.1 AraC family ligand binding domain-containing protein [Akkermansiaceae bacterium]MDF1710965.1 AraC family ligand binding domain-containing protein [Akkermansiaceae bacterium]
MTKNFITVTETKGACWEEVGPDCHPSSLGRWSENGLDLSDDGTHFLFVTEGQATLRFLDLEFPLPAGMYAAVPGSCEISGGAGIAVTRKGFHGFFNLGGPIEEEGRLRYIDGCTDSLLIPPVRWGDPCLNLLHIPANTHQSQHTHPSHRVGVIVSGRGHCITPDGKIPLVPGLVFVIPEESQHSFHTENKALRVIAYHPESDFGPTDETHPMVNKTILSDP